MRSPVCSTVVKTRSLEQSCAHNSFSCLVMSDSLGLPWTEAQHGPLSGISRKILGWVATFSSRRSS